MIEKVCHKNIHYRYLDDLFSHGMLDVENTSENQVRK